jgi:hypothetical protein
MTAAAAASSNAPTQMLPSPSAAAAS